MQDIKDELYFNKSTIAYYDYLNHKLRVLLDIVQKHSYNKEQYLWLLLKTVYHEYKHAIINEAKTNEIKSLEDFYLNLENITSANEKFYLQNHDNFYEEILANKYGVEKAATLLEQKYSKTKAYKKIKPSIAIEKILQEIYYENHTIDPFLDKINNTIKETVNDVDSYNLEMEYQLISILYNTDGSFKNLKQLSQDTGWQELPNEVQFLILSSESYLNEFDYNDASIEELYTILNALNYSYFVEKAKTYTNNSLRTKLNELNKKLIETDEYNLNVYLETLLVLNRKVKLNKKKLLSIKKHKDEIKKLINKKANPPKIKKLK